MSRAVRSLNYEGIFVYRDQGNLESMRLVHRVHDGVEQERLLALTGSPREVIRNGERVTCILPGDRSVLVDWRQSANPLSDVVPMDVDALRDTYRFGVLGDGRVAGRSAMRVAIEPRDRYRYGYHLWIDTDSHLLLRAELVDAGGRTVEQLMFTHLELRDHIPDKMLQRTVNGEGYSWYRHETPPEPVKDRSAWQVTQLPPGFSLKVSEWRTGADDQDRRIRHQLYSDGLASVSVYIETPKAGDGFVGLSSMGAVSAFGRMVDGYQTVVIGEVPAHTVEVIGRTLQHDGSQDHD